MAKPETSRTESKPRGRLFPPAWVWAIVALLLLVFAATQTALLWVDNAPAGLLGRGVLWLGDQAHANLVRFGCLVGLMFWPMLWFIVRSGYWLSLRLGVLAAIVGSAAAFFSYYKIDNVDGNLIPTFKRRGAKNPDEMLAVPVKGELSGDVDLRTTTPADFPQFLGPARNLSVEGVRLERDWQANPPKQMWRHEIGAGWSGFAVVNGFAVTMEQRGDEELVTCYNARTGEMQWLHGVKARHVDLIGGDGPRCTPMIHDGRVYALGGTGILRCLDGANGKLLWSHDLAEMYDVPSHAEDLKAVSWGRAGSPLAYDDLVVAPAGGLEKKPTSLVAFDADMGDKRWEAGNWQVSYASPAIGEIAGVRQVLSVNEGFASAHDPKDGTLLWSADWPSGSSSQPSASQPVVLPGDRVLLTKGYGQGAKLLKVSHEKGEWHAEELWSNPRVLKTKMTNVAVRGEYAYALSDGILECVSLEDGRREWKGGRYGHGQILLVGDVLLVQLETGEVAMVEASPDGFRELGQFPALDGKTWNNLCLFGPYLLVRNDREAACYLLPVETEAQKEAKGGGEAEADTKGEAAGEDEGERNDQAGETKSEENGESTP